MGDSMSADREFTWDDYRWNTRSDWRDYYRAHGEFPDPILWPNFYQSGQPGWLKRWLFVRAERKRAS